MPALNVAFWRLGGLGPKAGSEGTWVPAGGPGWPGDQPDGRDRSVVLPAAEGALGDSRRPDDGEQRYKHR